MKGEAFNHLRCHYQHHRHPYQYEMGGESVITYRLKLKLLPLDDLFFKHP